MRRRKDDATKDDVQICQIPRRYSSSFDLGWNNAVVGIKGENVGRKFIDLIQGPAEWIGIGLAVHGNYSLKA